MQIVAIAIFIALYIVMITLPKWKVPAALCAALLYVLLGILPLSKVFGAVNWNVLLMMAGTMVVVYYFIESKMPNRLADILLDKSKNVMWVIVYMSLFSGVISAFIDNVATVVMVAPVGLAICKKLKINPVPMILSIAVSSNLQGAATLVGDTTSIMLGAYAKMDFLDFFWMHGRPGIFFAVEIGALLTVPVMMILFRKDKEAVSAENLTEVRTYVPGALLLALVLTLIGASFIPNKPDLTNGVICMGYALIAVIYGSLERQMDDSLRQALYSIDFETLFLLIGIFIVIGGVSEAGIIDSIATFLARAGGDNLFLIYTLIVWVSVIASAFIDNIPYVATMLPVITSLARMLGIEPYLLYFGLLVGATLGGNLTPIGASANIAGCGILKKEGYEVKFSDFARIGIPFTLVAVLGGYLYLWIVWR